jgi:hypothetical protein
MSRSVASSLIDVLTQWRDVMRILIVVLALGMPASLAAQRFEPVGYHRSMARAPVPVPTLTVPKADSSPSVGRHILIGIAVGAVATGAGFLIEGAVNPGAYDDCMMCPIVVPIIIGAGGAIGGIGGAAVYGLRRLSAKERARRVPLPGS